MTEGVKELYIKEMRDQGYSADSVDEFHKVMIPYLLLSNGVKKDASICEIGIAEGHCSISAYNAGYRNLSAVDYVDVNFPKFTSKYNIRCHNVDITKDKLPFADNSVDAFLFFIRLNIYQMQL